MPVESWTFDAWFVAQHGKRPSPIDENRLMDRIQSMQRTLVADQSLLCAIQEWEARPTSTLYAWQIKDGQKRLREE